jgi:ankyrin repeat protein
MKNKMLLALLASASMQIIAMEEAQPQKEIAGAVVTNWEETLEHAVLDGDRALVELALKNNANPNMVGPRNRKPILLSALAVSRDYEIAKLLIEYGADVQGRDYFGNTPLHYEARFPNVDPRLIDVLITNHAQLNVQNNQGSTIFHSALNPDRVFKLLTLITPEEETRIEKLITALALIKNAKPPLPKDLRKLMNQEIINGLVQSHLDMMNQIITLKNSANKTAFEAVTDKGIRSSDPEIEKKKKEIAQLLDPANFEAQQRIRKRIENNIRRILFAPRAATKCAATADK